MASSNEVLIVRHGETDDTAADRARPHRVLASIVP